MVRLYLFAEGQTEQTFANMVLKPHLANCRVYMHNPVLIAHTRKKEKFIEVAEETLKRCKMTSTVF